MVKLWEVKGQEGSRHCLTLAATDTRHQAGNTVVTRESGGQYSASGHLWRVSCAQQRNVLILLDRVYTMETNQLSVTH